jgi:hypothetical protein
MNSRNLELMTRYQSHPLRAEIKSALEAAERFAEKASAIRSDRLLSQEGKTTAIKSQLKSTLRDVRDFGAPLAAMRSRLDGIQATITRPAFDKTDVAAALGRQEIRAAMRGMPLGDRAALLVGDDADPRWVDAVLEQPPLLSGTPKELYERALTQRLETLFKVEIAEGEALDTEIAESEAALTVAKQDLAISSGLLEHEFEAMAAEVESKRNAPWLKRTTDIEGNVIVEVVPLRGGPGRIASPDDLRDGKFYADHAAWLADRAA